MQQQILCPHSNGRFFHRVQQLIARKNSILRRLGLPDAVIFLPATLEEILDETYVMKGILFEKYPCISDEAPKFLFTLMKFFSENISLPKEVNIVNDTRLFMEKKALHNMHLESPAETFA